ncbi:elongation factor P maturation arginine rhamnosyltransferase EarP [Acidovorax sp. ACV01]|uniref:elongation factor P maturation arginine rhamnosyltransferase EarP n=1 Tax=Acidovorax sp. ACV01 TaxID=2769311 RepID=UPI00177F6CDC|nr:elongation factor P maturation arginine rhamnosyltransferase EarP [Acidovorax sp. ACV01]MBD9390723.1 elongation factor P maturation arginine rhamnosyltransferase EarP [Acidovorax sp. ACV01]
MNHPLPPLQWDVFCRVIDNFGDIGVCWRLVAQLAARGHRVRLWVDDASALQWMAPTGCPGVELRAWGSPPPGPDEAPPDVMVEAFGCEIAPDFIAYIAYQSSAKGQEDRKPVWINLEYLSAESYVERHHKLSSLLSSGPGAGWTRWFFYPGFTHATGGLLRERDLMARREAFDRGTWRAKHASAFGLGDGGPEQRWVSLFCYEPAALPELLWHCQAQPTQLLVTPGRPTAAVRAALAEDGVQNMSQIGHQRLSGGREQLLISYLPPRPQPAFDEMLWACDFNAVRGEDSLVRALWAGQALVWQIYPQHDNAHHDKLWAFLDWLQAPASLRQFHATWNGLDTAPLQWPDDDTLAEWTACIQAARARLLTQDNLVAQLLGFVAEKR